MPLMSDCNDLCVQVADYRHLRQNAQACPRVKDLLPPVVQWAEDKHEPAA